MWGDMGHLQLSQPGVPRGLGEAPSVVRLSNRLCAPTPRPSSLGSRAKGGGCFQ